MSLEAKASIWCGALAVLVCGLLGRTPLFSLPVGVLAMLACAFVLGRPGARS